MNNVIKSASLLATALLASCASMNAPKEVQVTQEVVVEASVEAINRPLRELALMRPDGALFVIMCGPEVRNFDQIEKGDMVTSRYVETLGARRLGRNEAAEEDFAEMEVGRAEAGAKPGAEIKKGYRVKVTVNKVDVKANRVVFTGPMGVVHKLHPQREEGKAFLKGLSKGDRVELVYGEAMAISVQ